MVPSQSKVCQSSRLSTGVPSHWWGLGSTHSITGRVRTGLSPCHTAVNHAGPLTAKGSQTSAMENLHVFARGKSLLLPISLQARTWGHPWHPAVPPKRGGNGCPQAPAPLDLSFVPHPEMSCVSSPTPHRSMCPFTGWGEKFPLPHGCCHLCNLLGSCLTLGLGFSLSHVGVTGLAELPSCLRFPTCSWSLSHNLALFCLSFPGKGRQ